MRTDWPPLYSLRSCLPLLAAVLVVLIFCTGVARFWDPYFGLTRFLQFHADAVATALPEMRDQPVYVYPHGGGYDGLYHAQIAYDPLLTSPDLEAAIDNVPYRARRILPSMTAWLVALGNPARIASVYAWINPVAWLGLAVLLWRVLAVRDWRAWLAWAGVLGSAGALHSVRFAVVDLPAAALFVLGMLLVERGWLRGATGACAAAALTRETAVLVLPGLWQGPWRSRDAWMRNLRRSVIAIVPLLLWLGYLLARVGPTNAGRDNFASPLAGWTGKWFEIVDALARAEHRWLVLTTLLAMVAISTQMVFFFVRMRPSDAWWRVGIVHAVLALVLGHVVWEGHPGAFTRVLLPMSVAFAVCVVRWRASLVWLVLGGLGIFAGVEPLRSVAVPLEHLSAGRAGGVSYLVRLDAGWYGRESHAGHAWSWSSGRGSIEFATDPAELASIPVRLRASGFGEPVLSIRDAEGPLWEGRLSREWQRIEFEARRGGDGVIRVTFSSDGEPVPESADPNARALAFGVVDVEVVE